MVQPFAERIAGGLVMSERQVELGANRVEEDAPGEQGQHQRTAFIPVDPVCRTVVLDRLQGKDDLGERTVVDQLRRDLPVVQHPAHAVAQIFAESMPLRLSSRLMEDRKRGERSTEENTSD